MRDIKHFYHYTVLIVFPSWVIEKLLANWNKFPHLVEIFFNYLLRSNALKEARKIIHYISVMNPADGFLYIFLNEQFINCATWEINSISVVIWEIGITKFCKSKPHFILDQQNFKMWEIAIALKRIVLFNPGLHFSTIKKLYCILGELRNQILQVWQNWNQNEDLHLKNRLHYPNCHWQLESDFDAYIIIELVGECWNKKWKRVFFL